MKLSSVFAIALGSALCLNCGSAFGELIVNGGFEFLGSTPSRFGSDYGVSPDNNLDTPAEGKFSVVPQATAWNNNFDNFVAHMIGKQMLIANGSDDATDRVWYQDVNLHRGWIYDVSFWATSAYGGAGDAPANLVFEIDGSPLFALNLAGTSQGDWKKAARQFTATSTGLATLSIRDLTTATIGNDFALDDISVKLNAVPEPGSLALLSVGCLLGLGVWALRRRHGTS